MEGLEFHCDSLGFISEAAALLLFSLPSQLRPVLISSSCYSSRISTQNSSGQGTGGGVCCALECLGKYLLLKCIIWIGMSKVCPAQSQNPTVPGSGRTKWDKSSSSEKSAISSWFWWNFLHKTPQSTLCFSSSNLSSLCFWLLGITALLGFVIPTAPLPKELELQDNLRKEDLQGSVPFILLFQ